MHAASLLLEVKRGARNCVLSALKGCVLISLLVVSAQSGAVVLTPVSTTSSDQERMMISALERVTRDATKELVGLRQSGGVLEEVFFPQYVDRLSEGTVSTWRLKQVQSDGSTKVIAKWDARNGKSVSQQISIKREGVEQFSHYGGGRPKLRDVVGDEQYRYSDAEVKAIERAVQVRQSKGLRPSEVILEGVVDKSPCSNCLRNLRDAELPVETSASDPLNAISSTKAAGRIEVFHLDGKAKREFRDIRMKAVKEELSATCH